MRFPRGKCDWILRITAWTLIFQAAGHLYQLGATFGQINEIQVQCVGRELHFPQATHKIVVNTSAEQGTRIDRASDIDPGGGQHGKLASDVRMIRVNIIHHSDELGMESSSLNYHQDNSLEIRTRQKLVMDEISWMRRCTVTLCH